MREYQCTLIRHGKTAGNRERRYMGGRTDEPLLPEERQFLQKKKAPEVTHVFVSPMTRCVETAEILFPRHELILVPEFREMDFGVAEYRNHEEMNGLGWYQRFIDTNGESGFPEGETLQEFSRRVISGGGRLGDLTGDIALVVHGGTIMALMDDWSDPHEDFYHWMTENGAGWTGSIRGNGKEGFRLRSIVPWA